MGKKSSFKKREKVLRTFSSLFSIRGATKSKRSPSIKKKRKANKREIKIIMIIGNLLKGFSNIKEKPKQKENMIKRVKKRKKEMSIMNNLKKNRLSARCEYSLNGLIISGLFFESWWMKMNVPLLDNHKKIKKIARIIKRMPIRVTKKMGKVVNKASLRSVLLISSKLKFLKPKLK